MRLKRAMGQPHVWPGKPLSVNIPPTNPCRHCSRSSWQLKGAVSRRFGTTMHCAMPWRRIPAPLAWMVQARLQLYGLQATWGMLAELAWLSPRRLDEVVRHAVDPSLQQLTRKFEASFEGSGEPGDLAWFPAWVLTERPALAATLALAQPSQHSAPEKAMRVLIELLGLERQGRHHDVVARRKILRDIPPSLYAEYMKTR